MKPKLFENNLTVHKLLGDVSEDEFEVRYLEVDKVKDEVVELYKVWGSCMNLVSQFLLFEAKMKSHGALSTGSFFIKSSEHPCAIPCCAALSTTRGGE